MRRIWNILLIVLLLSACRTPHESSTQAVTTPDAPVWSMRIEPKAGVMPPVIVYKTRADYNDNVPVKLDPLRTRIVSYPDPSDVRRGNGTFSTPTLLNDGYLLDNRGVGQFTAFLDYTYAEYSQLDSVPSLEVLMSRIIDKQPFVELWDCGSRTKYNDLINDLNALIQEGFPGCRPVIDRRPSR